MWARVYFGRGMGVVVVVGVFIAGSERVLAVVEIWLRLSSGLADGRGAVGFGLGFVKGRQMGFRKHGTSLFLMGLSDSLCRR